MGTIIDTKESRAVQTFLQKSKEAFAAQIARNKVKSIDISSCILDDTEPSVVRFAVVGSVETTSPTGKLKTYEYRATVDVDGKNCKFADLKVLPLEES